MGYAYTFQGLQIRLIFAMLSTARLAGNSWQGLIWRLAYLLVVRMSLGCGNVAGRQAITETQYGDHLQ